MNNYSFTVADIFVEPYAVTPQLTARLRITEATGQQIHAMVLRCQVRIEPQRRRYELTEEHNLLGLFGERERWADTLRPLLWMHCNATVPGFRSVTDTELVLPCSYDFDVVGSRYLHALDGGTVPLSLLFSGTVFTNGSTGFGVEQVPWDCEAHYQLPVAVWRQLIDSYFPNTGWIRLDRDVLAGLADYRARHGLLSWDEAVQGLLAGRDEVVP